MTQYPVPAVVGVAASHPSRAGAIAEENLRHILDESGLFTRVELISDLEQAPDLVVAIRGSCAVNPTTLVPMFTFMTLGIIPTFIRDRLGHSLAFYSP